jgi:hypothetical protein
MMLTPDGWVRELTVSGQPRLEIVGLQVSRALTRYGRRCPRNKIWSEKACRPFAADRVPSKSRGKSS